MALKTKITKKTEAVVESVAEQESHDVKDVDKDAQVSARPAKRGCFFCQNKKEPEYIDSVTLRKFLSDRSRIVPKMRSGLCSKHQRYLTREIKYARHLALLPFVPSI